MTIVPVENMERAVEFYRDKLGLSLKFATPEWSEFETEPVVLALQKAKRETGPQRDEEARFTMDVEDIEAEGRRLDARGIEFVVPPHEEEYGMMAVFHDSEGNGIELVQRKKG